MTTTAVVEAVTPRGESGASPPVVLKRGDRAEPKKFRWRQTSVALIAIALGVVAVVWAAFDAGRAGACVLVGLSALASGGLIGFLFGVPPSTQAKPLPLTNPVAHEATAKPNEGAATARSNTALQEISSWLTRIIVGAGLVNLREFTSWLGMLGKYAGSLAGLRGGDARLFGAALIVYFAVVGFLICYAYARTVMAFLFAQSDLATQNTIADHS